MRAETLVCTAAERRLRKNTAQREAASSSRDDSFFQHTSNGRARINDKASYGRACLGDFHRKLNSCSMLTAKLCARLAPASASVETRETIGNQSSAWGFFRTGVNFLIVHNRLDLKRLSRCEKAQWRVFTGTGPIDPRATILLIDGESYILDIRAGDQKITHCRGDT